MIISCQSDGAVVGVKATMTDGALVTVNAKSVIRATDGYAKNEEMLAKNEDFLPNNLYGSVPNTCMGDGLTMAMAVGAKIFDAPGLQLVYVSYDCCCGINEESSLIVSENGMRVVDEYTYQSHVAQALADADSTCGYYIAAKKDGYAAEPYPMIRDDGACAACGDHRGARGPHRRGRCGAHCDCQRC